MNLFSTTPVKPKGQMNVPFDQLQDIRNTIADIKNRVKQLEDSYDQLEAELDGRNDELQEELDEANAQIEALKSDTRETRLDVQNTVNHMMGIITALRHTAKFDDVKPLKLRMEDYNPNELLTYEMLGNLTKKIRNEEKEG